MPARVADARLCGTVDRRELSEPAIFQVFANPLFDTTECFANDPVPRTRPERSRVGDPLGMLQDKVETG
jgi:hypothetical protein